LLKVVLSTFWVVFLAELGDKTQLTTMLLVAEGKKPLAVLIGAASALVLSSVVGVMAGGLIARYVPEMWVRIAAGAGFVVIGIMLLAGKF
jgi:putative Ca2+/H+ antiporter (TMEM165/GDT1 family)